MTPTELLDRAADFAKAEKRVVIIASGPSQREVIRKGLLRRLDPAQLERVALTTSLSDAGRHPFDVLMATEEAVKLAPQVERHLVAEFASSAEAAQP